MKTLLPSLAAAAIVACAANAAPAATPAPHATPAHSAAATAAAKAAAAFNAQIIALVKETKKLTIDKSVPPSEGFNPKTQPYVNILGVPEGEAVGGYIDTSGAHRGMLSNGDAVLAIPLESGGSGGVFTQIVFARPSAPSGNAKYVYAGYISSAGHLGVQIKAGTIVATLPYYGPKDPNCCPSKMIVQTYTVQSGSLRKLTDKTIPTPKPK